MNNQLPAWISPPTHRQQQTENYRQWRALIRERVIQNPPVFLHHLSEAEIRQTLAAVDHATGAAEAQKPSPLIMRTRAYERQLELIAWSYFRLMGDEFRAIKKTLSPDDFSGMLSKIGISPEEARLAILVAEAHDKD